jgi:hypothetical protein
MSLVLLHRVTANSIFAIPAFTEPKALFLRSIVKASARKGTTPWSNHTETDLISMVSRLVALLLFLHSNLLIDREPCKRMTASLWHPIRAFVLRKLNNHYQVTQLQVLLVQSFDFPSPSSHPYYPLHSTTRTQLRRLFLITLRHHPQQQPLPFQQQRQPLAYVELVQVGILRKAT